MTKSGNYKHGYSPSTGCAPTYVAWAGIVQRCNNPKNKAFRHYGGRGITVCERWLDFPNFLEDMGERPEGRSIDRIDNNGNYEPGNCRWATTVEQRHNQRPPQRRSQCRRGHLFDAANTWIGKNGWRRCRQCNRENKRRYRLTRTED